MGRRYGENAFSTLELENALEKIYSQDSTDFSFKSVETVLKDDIAKSGKNKNGHKTIKALLIFCQLKTCNKTLIG